MTGSGEKPTCGEIIFIVVSVAILMGGFITFLVWEFYLPDFPEFSVSGFEVSNFKLSPNSLTSDFIVSVAVRNPNNKFSIRYDDVQAAVLYSTGGPGDAVLNVNDFVIATKPTFPFSQRPQDVTHLKARLGTVRFHADEDRIRSGDGEVRFGVRIYAAVGFKAGAWKPPADYDVKVYCDDVRVGLKNSAPVAGFGSMVGPARGCWVWYTYRNA